MNRTPASLLKEWRSSAEAHLVTNRIEVEKLASAISAADSQAGQVAEQAGPKLIEALLRVKDTAEQAAERARQSLARTIPEAAEAPGQAAHKACAAAATEKGRRPMEKYPKIAPH